MDSSATYGNQATMLTIPDDEGNRELFAVASGPLGREPLFCLEGSTNTKRLISAHNIEDDAGVLNAFEAPQLLLPGVQNGDADTEATVACEGNSVNIQSEVKDNSKTSQHRGSKGIAGEVGVIRQVWCRVRRDQDAIFERLTMRDGVETRELLARLGSKAQRAGYAIITSARQKGPPSSAAEEVASTPRTARPSAGETIDRWRAVNGCSLESLAYKAGIDISTLWRIRRGKFRYSTHTECLKAVATVIGCDWKDLVQKGTEPSRLPRQVNGFCTGA